MESPAPGEAAAGKGELFLPIVLRTFRGSVSLGLARASLSPRIGMQGADRPNLSHVPTPGRVSTFREVLSKGDGCGTQKEGDRGRSDSNPPGAQRPPV